MKELLAICIIAAALGTASAQTPSGPGPSSHSTIPDTSIIFTPSHPLLEEHSVITNPLRNSWGLSGFFNDYGWGLGVYYRHLLSNDLSVMAQLDLGTAKGPKEFGFYTEIKINRIFVMPLMVNLQYRILEDILGPGFRPYITAGVGPTFVATTDGQKDFFVALVNPTFHTTFGGNIGFGAYFGLDPKTTFGASIRYYIIPYPSPGIESTQGTFLTDFSAISLTVTYGFNF